MVHRTPNRRTVIAACLPHGELEKWVHDLKTCAGTPPAANLLRTAWTSSSENGEELNDIEKVELTAAAFPHPLDDFQLQAVSALSRGESAVVSAPTGSGKTVIGEAAVYLALASGQRAFYTTPLKALSNQKFNDFKQQFGDRRVGLLTGDVSVNRDADVVVMTTEVYRNMLYASESGSEVSGVAPSVIDDVHAVVFDEFHFMNDRERGTVWEESVIISPRHTLLVALSATMRNVDDVRDWFEDVHGPTELVVSTFRPVPLDFLFCNRSGVYSLMSPKTAPSGRPAINPKVCAPEVLKAAALRVEHRGIAGDWNEDERKGKKPRRGTRRASVQEISKELDYMFEDGLKKGKMLKAMNVRPSQQDIPSYGFLVRSLKRRNMLPAIVFIFSRGGCDRAASMVSEGEQMSLLTEDEVIELDRRISDFERIHPNIVGDDKLRMARKGIASHHAGLLPLWKAIVEELFQDGLIKVVFATETLAAGINMPARTTAITSLSKRAGAEGIVDLTTSEIFQMAGRAGRRGKDKRGFCVIVKSQFEGAENAYHMINCDVDALNSTFTATYGMVLNLLQRRDLDGSRSLIEKSFGSFLLRRGRRQRYEQSGLSSDLEQFLDAKKVLEGTSLEQVADMTKQADRVRTEEKLLKKLIQIEVADQMDSLATGASYAPPGTPMLVFRPGALKSSQGRKNEKAEFMSSVCEELLEHGELSEASRTNLEEAVLVTSSVDEDEQHLLVILTRENILRAITQEDVYLFDYETAPIEVSAVCKDKWQFTVDRVFEDARRSRRAKLVETEGGPEMEPLAAAVPSVAVPPVAGHIASQYALTRDAATRLEACELYQRDDRDEMMRSLKLVRKLRKRFTVSQLRAVEKRIEKDLVVEATNWNDFLSAAEVLKDFGFLTEDRKLTQMGSLGAALRSNNELWVSIVLLSDLVVGLLPHELAGLESNPFSRVCGRILSSKAVASNFFLRELTVESACADMISETQLTAIFFGKKQVSMYRLANGNAVDEAALISVVVTVSALVGFGLEANHGAVDVEARSDFFHGPVGSDGQRIAQKGSLHASQWAPK
eukprot:CAMPEP_0198724568 /NCGR_PEP_ID=MMETSP1475-20131203/2029_1 /TAXON_ID= ORGANISM="Unidentified sp., Strain CCMP1999" /NCGR_SAMPLE_ID=MMETSP1475 /ASSEMBLY_ACC=CAM_ASM_001111 /LENGTH=1060 /DNA_ID=CAMNT_0044486133 /DNA_START=9 /DNA_END=3193 /DNA_ORIENTATION=+